MSAVESHRLSFPSLPGEGLPNTLPSPASLETETQPPSASDPQVREPRGNLISDLAGSIRLPRPHPGPRPSRSIMPLARLQVAFSVITFNAAGHGPNVRDGALGPAHQMDDEVLIIPQGAVPQKVVINFSELHQFRDILYGQTVRETVI